MMKKTLTCISLAFCLSSFSQGLQAQTGVANLPQLVQELEQHYGQLQQLGATLDENTRTREALLAEANALNAENDQLDQQLSDYHAALESLNAGIEDYTRNCAGQALGNEAFSTCENQRMRLKNLNNQLTAQSEQLSVREARYSARVDEINARENERALAAQQIISRYQQAETAFDRVVARLVQIDMLS